MSGRRWRRHRVTVAALATVVLPGLAVVLFPDLRGYGGFAFWDCDAGCPRCYRPPPPRSPQETGGATTPDAGPPTEEPGAGEETGGPRNLPNRPRVPDGVTRPRVDPGSSGPKPSPQKY